MNINLMRKIDLIIGIPLSFIFTIFDKVAAIFKSKKNPPHSENFKKILFIKLSEMGTTILLMPTIDRLNELFPENKKFFLVFKENALIVSFLKIIPEENILIVRTDNLIVLIYDLIRYIIFLRKEKIDVSFDLEFFSRVSAIIGWLTNATQRIGFHRFNWEGLYRGDLLTHKVCYNPFLHTAQNFLILAESVLKEPGFIVSKEQVKELNDLVIRKLNFTVQEKNSILEKIRKKNSSINEDSKFIIFNPDTSEFLPYRKWPEKYFIELGNMIVENNRNVFILLTGTKHSKIIGDDIEKSINKNIINLVGKTTIEELFLLYSVSHILVSVDSGPVHFAALTDLNIICIFGPDTPIAFAPLSKNCVNLTCGLNCHPCYSVFNNRTANCKDNEKRCLTEISPEKVYEIIKEKIN